MNLQRSAFCQLLTRQQLELVRIQHPLFSAEIALQGAQLLQFQPRQQHNWLWLSDQAEYLKGQSVRGGIPICWPWFGDLRRNPTQVQDSLPFAQGNQALSNQAHGIARSADWQLSHLYEAVDQVQLILKLPTKVIQTLALDISLELQLTLRAQSFIIALINRNLGQHSVHISQALHTYLPVDAIQNASISGLHGCDYIDAVDNWSSKTQQGPVTFSAETDRIYRSPSQLLLHHSGQTRHLHSNSCSAVVWNPWINKAVVLASLTRMPGSAWYA